MRRLLGLSRTMSSVRGWKELSNQFLLLAYIQRRASRCREVTIADLGSSLPREKSQWDYISCGYPRHLRTGARESNYVDASLTQVWSIVLAQERS